MTDTSDACSRKRSANGAARPALARLLNALAPMPAFQVLIMSEESRLGREAIETAWALLY